MPKRWHIYTCEQCHGNGYSRFPPPPTGNICRRCRRPPPILILNRCRFCQHEAPNHHLYCHSCSQATPEILRKALSSATHATGPKAGLRVSLVLSRINGSLARKGLTA